MEACRDSLHDLETKKNEEVESLLSELETQRQENEAKIAEQEAAGAAALTKCEENWSGKLADILAKEEAEIAALQAHAAELQSEHRARATRRKAPRRVRCTQKGTRISSWHGKERNTTQDYGEREEAL